MVMGKLRFGMVIILTYYEYVGVTQPLLLKRIVLMRYWLRLRSIVGLSRNLIYLDLVMLWVSNSNLFHRCFLYFYEWVDKANIQMLVDIL